MLIAVVDIVYCMVLLLRPHEYIIEIYPECISKTSYAYAHTIRLRLDLLPTLFMVSIHISRS